MDEVTSLINAIAALVSAVVWPLFFLFVLIRFRSPIGEFIANMSEFSLKAPGLEASAKIQQIEAAAALGAAVASHASVGQGEAASSSARDVAGALVGALPDARAQRRIEGALVLWVDDRPDNNRYERQALEALGVHTEISTSTEDAIEKLAQRTYDVVVSDMGRPPDSRAGYTLLDRLRRDGNAVPFVIYAASRDPEHVRESREHGAIGCTNRADELFSMVTQAIAARR